MSERRQLLTGLHLVSLLDKYTISSDFLTPRNEDTGSSDLWFQSEACVGCEGAKIKTTSSTLQQTGRPFSIRYGSGAVQGTIVSDHVEMGGFAVENQVMGMVTQTSGVLLNGNSAGLYGLAFQVRYDVNKGSALSESFCLRDYLIPNQSHSGRPS
jgi:hypothetical protein